MNCLHNISISQEKELNIENELGIVKDMRPGIKCCRVRIPLKSIVSGTITTSFK